MKKLLLCGLMVCQLISFSQLHKRALFLGNSYTQYNDLPALTSQLANSAGDTLDVEYNYPGGTTLGFHSVNETSQALIAEGNWDYVVLQEQSQLPAFPIENVEVDCYPYATLLNEQILAASPCAETMFYMTWGRKNGDAGNCDFWPPMCTYEGMDDLLKERYMAMAEMNDAVVAPVGAVRRFIRENFPDIELYVADESHPSMEGSYVAAVCFYTCIFRKDPQLITFDYGIDDGIESTVKQVVHDIVYNALSDWYITNYDPMASFEIEHLTGSTFSFTNTSINANEYFVYNSATDLSEPLTSNSFEYTFPGIGSYEICLHAVQCDYESEICYQFVDGVLSTEEINQPGFLIYPNPTENSLNVRVENWHNNFQVRIFDAKGSLLSSRTCKNNQSIDISEFQPGVYFLEVLYGDHLTRQPFQKM